MAAAVINDRTVNLYQTHPLRDAVKNLGAMSPKQYTDVIAAAQSHFFEQAKKIAAKHCEVSPAQTAANLDDMPQLAAPEGSGAASTLDAVQSAGQPQFTGQAALTALIGQLSELVSNNTIEDLQNQADLWNNLSQATQANLNRLSDQANQAVSDASTAAQSAQTAQAAADQASAAAKDADAQVQTAQQQYDKDVSNGAPQSQIDADKTGLDAAKANAATQHQKANAFQKTANDKTSTATQAALKAQNAEDQANAAANAAIQQLGPNSPMQPAPSTSLTGMALLTSIMGQLQDLISKSTVETQQAQKGLLDDIQSKREVNLKQQSDDYEAKVKKADHMHKRMGCIGKIIGAIVTVASVAAAVVTGGASLAIAAVALTLTVTDKIVKAATGVDFMQKALQPVMDHVLKPMMQAISSVLTHALEAFGVSQDKAEMIGAILGAVIAAVAVVAAIAVGASAAKAVLSKAMTAVSEQVGKLAESAVAKAVTEMAEKLAEKTGLSTMAKTVSSGMGRLSNALSSLVESAEDAKLVATKTQKATNVLGAANQVGQAAGAAAVGVEMNQAMHFLANMKEQMFELQQLSAIRDQLTDAAEHAWKTMQAMWSDISAANQSVTSTGTTILNNVRHV